MPLVWDAGRQHGRGGVLREEHREVKFKPQHGDLTSETLMIERREQKNSEGYVKACSFGYVGPLLMFGVASFGYVGPLLMFGVAVQKSLHPGTA